MSTGPLSIAPLSIVPIKHIRARLVAYDWPFITTHKTEIADYWQRRISEKPAMFNGQVLMQCQGHVEADSFIADYFQLDFASMVAWQALGAPETEGMKTRNGFALAALRSRDGAYLMGAMGQHTHNAGKIYFPGGTPDTGDITPDASVDLSVSVRRELEEETGLMPHDVSMSDEWHVVSGRERVAFLRDVFIDLVADEARSLIRDRLSRQVQPELCDIVIARSVADIDEVRMPIFMQVFLRHVFSQS